MHDHRRRSCECSIARRAAETLEAQMRRGLKVLGELRPLFVFLATWLATEDLRLSGVSAEMFSEDGVAGEAQAAV